MWRNSIATHCALCRRPAELCKSHIIPEFLYASLYDKKHRFHSISADPARPNRVLQKGLKQSLLCEPCEQRLSVYEQYAQSFLNGGLPLNVKEAGNRLHVSGLEYSKLRLFQLSILWRASVSSLPEFSQVRLGPHEERIRALLHAQDPGPHDAYGCIVCALVHDKEVVEDLVVPPTWARIAGLKAYRFVFGGVVFVFVVSSNQIPEFIASHFLLPSGDLIIRLQQIREMRFLVDTVAKMHDLGRLD
jgi:hypothetical protein